MRLFLTTIILTMLAQPVWAEEEAQEFFNRYNKNPEVGPSIVSMICPRKDGAQIHLKADGKKVYFNEKPVNQVTKNGNEVQYFIKGLMYDTFLDFERKVQLDVFEGEVIERKVCK